VKPGQSDAAAERSASITREPEAGKDTRPAYEVALLDPRGDVVRSWQTRFETPPGRLRLRVRRISREET
jgi:hypothetical protein